MADIIDFNSIPKPSKDERLFRRTSSKPRTTFCRFHRFEYDPHDQTVWCAACEQVFSGFDAFLEIARSWEHMCMSRDHLRSEIGRLQEQHDRLKKDVNNLKSQGRRRGMTFGFGE